MQIHLIRHTTPDIDTGICYGQTDLGLAASFELEKAAVLNKLNSSYDMVYTSPLKRCALLAETVCGERRLSDQRLMEYNFGDWELLPWNEFKTPEAQNWMNNFVDQPAPNGDSMISMQKRVDEFWQELIKQPYERVAVVTHSGVMRIIHGLILSTPMTHLFRLQLEFGAVLEVNSDLKTSLLTVKHL